MNSFISWIGGKNYLKKEICNRMPADMDRYIEVFGGAAWVLFYKDKLADMEVYNDANSSLVNLFKCVKYHSPELQRELGFMLNSRELFEDFKVQYKMRGMTDIQRAARFFMLIKSSYGADNRSFGCSKRDTSTMVKYLDKIKDRLSKVVIENKDFESLISVYDRPEALFYLDPPYYGTEKYYQAEFTQDNHLRLCRVLKGIHGKFILSYNDCQFVKYLYSDFQIEEVSRVNNLLNRHGEGQVYKELIIRNY
ncbi:MAG TPA: DNA adenine methylase [Clostridia bacterium]